jgi:hypothetical protein
MHQEMRILVPPFAPYYTGAWANVANAPYHRDGAGWYAYVHRPLLPQPSVPEHWEFSSHGPYGERQTAITAALDALDGRKPVEPHPLYRAWARLKTWYRVRAH